MRAKMTKRELLDKLSEAIVLGYDGSDGSDVCAIYATELIKLVKRDLKHKSKEELQSRYDDDILPEYKGGSE